LCIHTQLCIMRVDIKVGTLLRLMDCPQLPEIRGTARNFSKGTYSIFFNKGDILEFF